MQGGIFLNTVDRPYRRHRLLAILALITMLAACRDAADDFFHGRPSDMAMAHNGALDGGVDSMRTILLIPSRLPDAREVHHAQWQESPIAWWMAPGGRSRIEQALRQLDRAQLAKLQTWLAAPEPYGENKRRAIAELRQAVAAAVSAKGQHR